MKTVVEDWPTDENLPANVKSKSTQTDITDTKQSIHDEGAIFLLLFCYYFQDIPIFTVQGIYTESDSEMVTDIKKWISSIFKLQLYVVDYFQKDLCLSPNFDPVSKAFARVVYIPIIFVLLITLSIISCRLSIKYPLSVTYNRLANEAVIGLTMSILLSHQTFAVTVYSMGMCITVGDSSVLFLDGNVTCINWWQWMCIFNISTFILPLGLYLAMAPKYIKAGHMRLWQFFVGCMFPLFAGFVFVIQSYHNKVTSREKPRSTESDIHRSHVGTICELLQGPHKETQHHIQQFETHCCWTGVLFMRRQVLATIYTLVKDPLTKMSLMSFVIFIYLVDTI